MSRVEPNRNVYVGHRYVPKILVSGIRKINMRGYLLLHTRGIVTQVKNESPLV